MDAKPFDALDWGIAQRRPETAQALAFAYTGACGYVSHSDLFSAIEEDASRAAGHQRPQIGLPENALHLSADQLRVKHHGMISAPGSRDPSSGMKDIRVK